MVITVFGASGKVGRYLVAEALARGHSVRAFIHRTNDFPNHPRLTLVKGDIHDVQSVANAVFGSQAVLCTLSSWKSPGKDVVSSGIRAIIPAMNANGIDRIVTVTGSGAFTDEEQPSFLRRCGHTFGKLVAGKVIADGEEHIRLLQASGLDWTTLRSPVMNNGARIFYKLSMRPAPTWQYVPRKAVAKAMLDQLDGASYSRSAPFIHRD